MADEEQVVVIDNGSSSMKAGFAGNEKPHSIFQSIIGRIRKDVTYVGNKSLNIFIGNEAYKNACISILEYPIKHGIITNWDDVEKIYHHIYYDKLHVDPAECPVFHTETHRNTRCNREKLIQLMFETFNVPSFYIARQGTLSLYASARTTGIVCDIGDGTTQIVPVEEGSEISNAIKYINFGGCDIIDWLQLLLEKNGHYFTTTEEREILRDIMKKRGYVAEDYDSELQKAKTTTECNCSYCFPDQNEITLSNECFQCTELLFKPYLNGFEFYGIDKMIFESIMKCEFDSRKTLFSNIVLAGGCTMFTGLQKRVLYEITGIAPPTMPAKVDARPERKYYDWEGGSIVGSLVTFPQNTIKKDEYNECGPGIVHNKCP